MSFGRTSLMIACGALWLGAVAFAPSAQAQSCDEPSVHSSYPADGAMGVPTNAPVYVYGPTLDDDAAITLQDADGEDVPIEVMSVEGGLLIDAYLGFAPSTGYELSVSPDGGDDWSASFTTGTGPAPLPAQLQAPDVAVSVLERDTGSCGVVSGICVIGSAPTRMTLEVVVGDEVMSLGGGEPPPAFLASAGRLAANACVEVRVREPGGFVSEATRLCGNALERFELAANVTAPRSCDAYQSAPAPDGADEDSEGESSGGCTLVPWGAAPSAGGLLLGLSAVLVVRQRRRAR